MQLKPSLGQQAVTDTMVKRRIRSFLATPWFLVQADYTVEVTAHSSTFTLIQSTGNFLAHLFEHLSYTSLHITQSVTSGDLLRASQNIFARRRNDPEVPPSASMQSRRPLAERLAVCGIGAVPGIKGSRHKVLLGHVLDDGEGENLPPGILAPLLFKKTMQCEDVRGIERASESDMIRFRE